MTIEYSQPNVYTYAIMLYEHTHEETELLFIVEQHK